MSVNLYTHRSRCPVVQIEDLVLSSSVHHPLQGRTIIEHTFKIHWLRESCSTMRLVHGDVPLDAAFGVYRDWSGFDSFASVLENIYLPFVARHALTPASSLRAEVVTSIVDYPYLPIDDPTVERLFGHHDSLRWALDDLPRSRAAGMEIYAGISDDWGIKRANEFAHERGQPAHLIARVQHRDVAERVVWHSGMATEPSAAHREALRAALAEEFGPPAQEAA